MKKILTILLFSIFVQQIFGQTNENLSRNQISVDFGSFRNIYLYPITNLSYSSPLLKKVNLKFSGRLRSYGTLYFLSKSAYDFTALAAYYFAETNRPIYFSVGVGMDSRIRLVNDERSEATNSVEPLLSMTLHGNYKKIAFNAPLWTRFYSNGVSFSLLPETSYQIAKNISVFFRYELSYHKVLKVSTYEWQKDCFIGTHILF